MVMIVSQAQSTRSTYGDDREPRAIKETQHGSVLIYKIWVPALNYAWVEGLGCYWPYNGCSEWVSALWRTDTSSICSCELGTARTYPGDVVRIRHRKMLGEVPVSLGGELWCVG